MMSPAGLGILLAFVAGAATMLGGCVIFFVKQFKPVLFSVFLSLSTGVMVYVSFVEIFSESTLLFTQHLLFYDWPSKDATKYAYLFATLGFFFGWIFTDILNATLQFIATRCCKIRHHKTKQNEREISCVGCVDQDFGQMMAESPTGSEAHQDGSTSEACPEPSVSTAVGQENATEKTDRESWWKTKTAKNFRTLLVRSETTESERLEIDFANRRFENSKHQSWELGMRTAIALALHNFPEGAASFVGTMADPRFGFSVAFAIGIHNIPEGFAVAVPIYFATGSKWKGFLYCAVAGLAEPIGALIAFAAIGNHGNDLVFGLLFAVVAGIMINVAIKELFPAAIKYDPTSKVVNYCFFAGMAVMAASLVAFEFAVNA